MNFENFDFLLISNSVFVNDLKTALKFKKRDNKLDTVFVNELELQIRKFFDTLPTKNSALGS